MAHGSEQLPPLDRVLARFKKQDKTLRGRLASLGNGWLERLESHAVVTRYGAFFRPGRRLGLVSEPRIDLDVLVVVSLTFHLLLLFFLTRVHVSEQTTVQPLPLVVRLIDPGPVAPAAKKELQAVPSTPPSGQPRTQRPLPPTPKATEVAPGDPSPAPAIAPPAPALPGPRALAEVPRDRTGIVAAPRAESLVQLPTRSADLAGAPSTSSKTDVLSGAIDDAASSRVPAALQKGSTQPAQAAANPAPASVTSRPDFGHYLAIIEKRVRSAWKYPEGITGTHKLSIVFVLDRSGNLIRAEIADSSEQRLNASAMHAVRTAAPFPPMPEALKELAGEPLRIRFTVESGIKSAK